MDDPLWGLQYRYDANQICQVLIPILMDDPLWVITTRAALERLGWVLIPILMDDPLWGEQPNFDYVRIDQS